ncbi:alpha/beta fold hydrolase [Bacillus suaedaesalsae]|uniref:Alpha/beta hydrolase n=1 Tax=Bacillus suaedaesalsae TaxID=2810349 RepID=A0ABS2DJS7_9BACI|nr:alpha/beta hydrolase [Bacillus suaedaesalsae]MBM6618728.1 alpha/beta hydrolase [Bacillus suaedaesalsae]
MTFEKNNEFTITIQGIPIHYELYHKEASNLKPTIVLIHGFLSSTFSFRRLVPLLAKEYRVVAVDLPPFGKSGKSKDFIYSYQNLASVVIELLSILDIKEIILVGHSMGGQISLNIAKLRPDLVRRMVLLCSSGYLERAKQALILSSYIPFFSLVLKRKLAKQGVMHSLINVVYDHSMIDDEMKTGYEEPFYNDEIFTAMTRFIRHREGDLPANELQSIDTKILLIWGREDKVVPLSVGERLHRDLKYSELITLEKTGHLLPEERPHHIKEQILQFI